MVTLNQIRKEINQIELLIVATFCANIGIIIELNTKKIISEFFGLLLILIGVGVYFTKKGS